MLTKYQENPLSDSNGKLIWDLENLKACGEILISDKRCIKVFSSSDKLN